MFPPWPELLLLYTLELWVLFQRCCNVDGKCCVGPTSTNIIDDFDVSTVKLCDQLFRKMYVLEKLEEFQNPSVCYFHQG